MNFFTSGLVIPMLLLFATLCNSSLPDKLKDGKNDVNSVVDDLQTLKRTVFAVGIVTSVLTLFVTSLSGTSDGGYLLEVKTPENGPLVISPPPLPIPFGIPSIASVRFVMSDTDGSSKLITMDNWNTGFVILPGGGYIKLNPSSPKDCFENGDVHISYDKVLLQYFTIQANGQVRRYSFGKNPSNIADMDYCGWTNYNEEGNFICTSGSQISIGKCTGSPVSGLVSGYIGPSYAYLFDSHNNVYIFNASIFEYTKNSTLPPVPFTKLSSKDAFTLTKGPNSKPSSETTKKSILFVVIGIFAGVLLAIVLAFLVVYCIFKGKSARRKTGRKGESKKKGASIDKKKSTACPSPGMGSLKKKNKSKMSNHGGSKMKISPAGSKNVAHRSTSKMAKGNNHSTAFTARSRL